MSEQPAAGPPPAGGGGGGMLTRKAGPLPVWGWLAVATLAAGGYYLWSSRGGGSASTATGATAPASSVPDYVSQTTVNLTEPAEGGPARPGPPPKRGGKGKKPVSPKGAARPGPVGGTGRSDQPPVMSNSYTVKAGDTLDKLAEKFGVSRVDLAHANGLGTGAGLRAGQVLHVPGPVRPRSEGGPG